MACNSYNIIQWNCRGLRGSREEIEILINKYSPSVMCIQETLLEEGNNPTFKNHHPFYASTKSGHGGAAIIVKDTIAHRRITLQSNLQAVAVNITIGQKAYTFCSVYIPHSNYVQINELNELKEQLPPPFIIMGDFNAKNPLWGSSESANVNGQVVERFIIEHNLILFNNKYPTRDDEYHGTSSLLDLTICQPSIFLDFDCNVFKNRHGSDHYPVHLIYNSTDSLDNERRPRWNFKKADWTTFRQMCHNMITDNIFNDDSEEMFFANYDKMKVFTDQLQQIAIETTPQTSPNPKKKPKPWFDDKCRDAIDKRDSAAKRCKQCATLQNVRQSQVLRAKCRRVIKQSKRSSWRQYVSSINNRTPIKKVWNQIRKITGKNVKLLHHVKDEHGELITDKKDIANVLGRQFQKASSSENYSPDF